jgi:small subunit ribosomal protein S6
MRRYETVFILDPDLSEEVRTQRYDKVKEVITAYEGVLIEFDDWGVRKLAYDIRKKTRGQYVRLDYCGDGTLVSELERNFRLDDKFLKFMTIILAENVNPEEVLAENELAKTAAYEAEAAAEAEKAAGVRAPAAPAVEAAVEAPVEAPVEAAVEAAAPAEEAKADEAVEPETKEEE